MGHDRRGGLLLALVLALGLLPAERAEALRCNGSLVSEGDAGFQVREACGAPDYVQPLYAYGHGHVVEELWYYNFGPHRLLRELRFRDGRLQRILTPGRGFRERERAGGCVPVDVATGMTAYELLTRCGEPAQREARSLLSRDHRGGIDYGYRRVWIEDWYYPFGDQYLDRRVRLTDGRVTDVDTVD
jgi:hypothetical protein